MSHNTIREDKTCLNCNHVVAEKFCPNCGQENTDTRKTFHHLFIHFFEDLTHYENAFWKTIKNLLIRPASLTKEYLSGKRLSYLAPVRLYIFISFATFFLIAILPENEDNETVTVNNNFSSKKYYDHGSKMKEAKIIDSLKTAKKDSLNKAEEIANIEKLRKTGIMNDAAADSIIKYIKERSTKDDKKGKNGFFNRQYKSIAEMDSIREIDPNRINAVEYWLSKKTIPLNDKYTDEELQEKFVESLSHNFPKTLFVYMPLFALILWLFHNKKRWYYFDHGIFTLHYFSFLLLTSLLITIINCVFSYFDYSIITVLQVIINIIGYVWMVYYFFPAHHRFYEETRVVSFFKSAFIFLINMFLASIVLILFIVYSFINIH